MSDKKIELTIYDEWLKDDSDIAALVMRQWLESVEGKDAVIFPPTYNLEKTDQAKRQKHGQTAPGWYETSKGDAYGYNIDEFDEGSNVCQIDSVGAQANRMEPLFKREPYSGLIPRVVIKTDNGEVNLLDAGHRAADAIARFSDLAEELEKAFIAIKGGDASQLAKIAPTSLVFGAWDSRATQVKMPRIVRSVIRAFNVKPLHRSAQYNPATAYVDEGLLDKPQNKTQQDAMSQLGLSHAPAPWTHGGICVRGEEGIRRDGTLNLAALRTLAAGPESEDETLALRRYVLGLAFVSFTAPQETFLREGCQLVPDIERHAELWLVRHDGKRDKLDLSHDEALAYAKAAADDFGVGESREVTFDAKTARAAVGQSKEERKSARRGKGKGTKSEAV